MEGGRKIASFWYVGSGPRPPNASSSSSSSSSNSKKKTVAASPSSDPTTGQPLPAVTFSKHCRFNQICGNLAPDQKQVKMFSIWAHNTDGSMEVETLMQEFNIRYWTSQILKLLLENEILTKQDCLNCRLVCSSWNESVLQYIQAHPSHFQLNSRRNIGLRYYLRREPSWQTSLQKDWLTPEKIAKSWESISPVYRRTMNPFISRKIYISDRCSSAPNPNKPAVLRDWGAKITSILVAYGRHVHICEIKFSSEMDTVMRYLNLQHWLRLMPNLKELQLHYRDHPTSTGWVEREESLVQQVGILPLHPLAYLCSLKTVNVPCHVFNAIASKVPKDQLATLQIEESNYMDEWYRMNLDQYNLVEFGKGLLEASIKLQSKSDYYELESMPIVWPLGKLHLQLDFGWSLAEGYFRHMDWNRIFQFVGEKFGSTLTHLGLVLPVACPKSKQKELLEQSLSYRLDLERVQELRIQMSSLASLDFLLPMKDSLEELFLHFSSVDFSLMETEEFKTLLGKQTIQLNPTKLFKETSKHYSCNKDNFDEEGHPLKSNIWREFSKLKRLALQFSSCFVMVGTARKNIGGETAELQTVFERSNNDVGILAEVVMAS